jgi:hypothetical protein
MSTIRQQHPELRRLKCKQRQRNSQMATQQFFDCITTLEEKEQEIGGMMVQKYNCNFLRRIYQKFQMDKILIN